MKNDLFLEAIKQTFPDSDAALQEEIYTKVLAHILEVLKSKVYAHDSTGLQNLYQITNAEQDERIRTQLYKERILQKLLTLSSDEQGRIEQELEKELTETMHKIYTAYE